LKSPEQFWPQERLTRLSYLISSLHLSACSRCGSQIYGWIPPDKSSSTSASH